MARIRGSAVTSEMHLAQLTDRLLVALKGQNPTSGPVIFEIPIDRSDTFHVIVVWDRWEELPPGDRSMIIADAYRRLDEAGLDEPISQKITTSLGVTTKEAIEFHLLPYVVRPSPARDNPRFAEILDAMITEGAVETPAGLELRFPTMRMARSACDRLRDFTSRFDSGIHWGIAQDLGHTQGFVDEF